MKVQRRFCVPVHCMMWSVTQRHQWRCSSSMPAPRTQLAAAVGSTVTATSSEATTAAEIVIARSPNS